VNYSKPLKLQYKVLRTGYLNCVVEENRLMWYESVFVFPSRRGRGYCKWLFSESISDFSGRIEVDVHSGVPELTYIFRKLGFTRDGSSQRYERCKLWKLSSRSKSRVHHLRKNTVKPVLHKIKKWETSRFRWRVKIYKLNFGCKEKV